MPRSELTTAKVEPAPDDASRAILARPGDRRDIFASLGAAGLALLAALGLDDGAAQAKRGNAGGKRSGKKRKGNKGSGKKG
jgi:hypothetical protein